MHIHKTTHSYTPHVLFDRLIYSKTCLFWPQHLTFDLFLRRFIVLQSGSLKISDVRLIDSKFYTCSAANPAGNVSLTYNLQVQGTIQQFQDLSLEKLLKYMK